MIAKVNVPELRGLIAKNGHSLRSFAKYSDVSLSYLSMIVNNHVVPSPKTAKKISDSLNVQITDLFEFKLEEVKSHA